jgi:2-methylcitrate dehydratase PrpD
MESVLFHHAPTLGLEGKFSLEYVLARTLLDGVPSIADFSDERVNEPRVRRLMKMVRWVSFQPPPGTFGTPEFSLTLQGGGRHQCSVQFPRGEPENPVSDQMLQGKFRDCALRVVPVTVVEELLEVIDDLPELSNVSRMTQLLAGAVS